MNNKIFKNIPLLLFFLFIFGPALGKNGVAFIIFIILIYFIIKKLKGFNLGNFKTKNNMDNMDKVIDMDKIKGVKNFKKYFLSAFAAILLIWLFFSSIVIVEAGETGVYSLFGRVKDEELKSGFHLVIPLAKVTKMTIRTEEYTMSIAQDEGNIRGEADAITSLTKEGLKVDLDITVLYRLDEKKASDVYKDIGLGYEFKIIRPAIRTSIRDVIAQYEAKDIYSEKREAAAGKIFEALTETLGERGIIAEEVLLRNVALPDNLANTIQEKLQAEQEAEKYDFILAKELKEKERKIIEAEGERDAQQIINQSLTQNYLYYLYVKELKEREGTIYVPTSPSTGMPLFREIGS
jgi:regulator of protease activity HflC (stomatin/prohibitin superfamily)